MSTSENSKKVYPLYNDLMFKHIFGIKENIRFTRYLLDKMNMCPKDMLKDIEIINSYKLTAESYENKKFELDVLIKLPNDDLINLEMYDRPTMSSIVKSDMYVCRLYGKQLKVGNEYSSAKKIIQYNFFKSGEVKRDQAISPFGIWGEAERKHADKDYLQIYDIKIDQSKKDMKKEVKNLLDFMNAETKEEMEKIAKKDEVLEDMFKEMKIYSEGDDFITPCYDRDGYLLSVGKDQGIAQGKKEVIMSVIKNMLNNNISPEDIAKYTDLTIEEVNDYKNQD